jgi:hypothetical protein
MRVFVGLYTTTDGAATPVLPLQHEHAIEWWPNLRQRQAPVVVPTQQHSPGSISVQINNMSVSWYGGAQLRGDCGNAAAATTQGSSVALPSRT